MRRAAGRGARGAPQKKTVETRAANVANVALVKPQAELQVAEGQPPAPSSISSTKHSKKIKSMSETFHVSFV